MKIGLLIATSLTLVALLLAGCTEPSDEPTEPQTLTPAEPAEEITEPTDESIEPQYLHPPGPPPFIGLLVEASTDKVYYALGEQVEVELSVHNPMSYPVIVSPFPPEIEIWLQNWNTLTVNKELIRSFIPEGNEVQFDADETKTYSFIWDQKDSDGNQATPGRDYLVQIHCRAWNASGGGPTGGSEDTPTHILIQHPRGAMVKTIEANQSQTVSNLAFMKRGEEIHTDVTMTLETVELFAEGTRLSVLCYSPHYPIGNTEIILGPPWWGEAYAQYLIDGIVKYDGLRSQSIGFREEGVRLVWGDHDYLDPVPSDAKELTFIITRWGDWEGPWEFHVPLD